MLRNGAGLHHVQTLSWTYDIFGFSTFENNNDLNKGIGDFVTRTIKYGEDAPGTWNSILLCVLRHPFFCNTCILHDMLFLPHHGLPIVLLRHCRM
jgi:hypothetical protein